MALLTLKCLSDFVTVGLVLFGIFYIYAKYKLSYWKRRGVPSPPTNILFGSFKDALFLRKSPSQIFSDIHNYAESDFPCVGFYVLQRPSLLVRNPELIKSILVKDFESFSDRHFGRHTTKDIPGSKNLFSLGQPQWKYARSKLSPALTSGKLKRMAPLMIENAQEMLKYIDAQPTDKNSMKAMRMKETSSKYTTDIIASLAFGIKTNSFEIPVPEFRARTVELGALSITRGFQLFLVSFFSELSDFIGGTMMGRTTSYFRSVFWNSMEAREKSGSLRGDLIDALLVLKNDEQHPDFKFDGDNLYAQSAVFFIAGLETSSTTIAFSLLELAKHPELQDRARRDIEENFAEHGVTLEAFQGMKYLNQVVSETLRIYPPAPIIDRFASKDYKIPNTNVIIEKDTPVYISLDGLQKDPKYYPDPLEFDPDRFSDERKKLLPSMTYMPFGEGPRICIGQRIGLLQTIIGLAMVLFEYEITINPEKETRIDTKSVFLALTDDVNLLLKKIER